MPLAQEDFESITKHIKENLPTWLAEQSLVQPPHIYEIELKERMVRVEEELKNQRELMKQGFDLMEKRFAQIDKHYEDLRQDMMNRFEQVDRRFEQVDKRFEQSLARMDRLMKMNFWLTMTVGGVIIAVIKFL